MTKPLFSTWYQSILCAVGFQKVQIEAKSLIKCGTVYQPLIVMREGY